MSRLAVEAIAGRDEAEFLHSSWLWDEGFAPPGWTLGMTVMFLRYVDDLLMGSRVLCPGCMRKISDRIYRCKFDQQHEGKQATWCDFRLSVDHQDQACLTPDLKNWDYCRGRVNRKIPDSIPPPWSPQSPQVIAGVLVDDSVRYCVTLYLHLA